MKIELDRPVDLGLTLFPVRRGRLDPTMRLTPGEAWRATRTPEGPATTRLVARGSTVTVRAWGPGAGWALAAARDLVGASDDDRGFTPHDPVVDGLRLRFRGLRLCRTNAVAEAIVPAILEQKVIGLEARRSYAALVRRLGEPAPGPLPGLLLPPDPAVLARTPTWVFHRCNIERKRADTIRLAASYASRLDETAGLPPHAAYRRITALPGVGAWTAAEVGMVAFGDADAVSVGDYHLPHHVAWALAGEPRADDARMLELLEPYRGHRGRVVRLIMAGGPSPPRYGPRLPLKQISGL
ncbi:MAG: DNA-3-methyladenine glycosylase family protein [Acidimicrobiia bacterium]